ncbi:MAG: hypothetical protein QOJ01_1230 [Solirubrobacterales bacterium]|jgi:hypothetical protein|nr:hypothetical protein [Solirubrobacterales bacterium]
MSEPDEKPETKQPPVESGLFSQLPRKRPGTRSPRRSPAAGSKPQPKAKAQKPAAVRAAAAAQSAAPTPPRASKPPPTALPRREPGARGRPTTAPSEPAPEGAPSGIEDLAWAGIAVTAEAATLGVRLLGRAFEAARKAADRG